MVEGFARPVLGGALLLDGLSRDSQYAQLYGCRSHLVL